MSKILVDRISPYTAGGRVAIDSPAFSGTLWVDPTHPSFGAFSNEEVAGFDSLAAINAALAYLATKGGGLLYVPRGTFLVSAALTIPAGVPIRIVGAGRFLTKIKHKTGGAVVNWVQTHLAAEFGSGIEHIGFDGNNTSSTVVTLNGLTLAFITSIHVTNSLGVGTGIKLVSIWDSNISSVYVEDCGDSTHPCTILDANGVGNDSLNNCQFSDWHVEPSDCDARYLDMQGNATNGIDDNKFVGLKLHGNPTSGNPAREVLNMSQYVHGNDFYASIIAFGKGAGVAQVLCDGQRNHFWGGTWGIGGAGVPSYAIKFTANANANAVHSPTITTPNGYNTPNVVFRFDASSKYNAVLDVLGNYGGVAPYSDAGSNIVRWADTSTAIGFQTYSATGIATVFPGFVQTEEFITPLTDAVTIAVNARDSNAFKVTLGGNRTMGAPSNPVAGQTIKFLILQDGTGGRTLAWNAAFKHAWSDAGNTLNKRSTIVFQYDGSNWNQLGAQSPYV